MGDKGAGLALREGGTHSGAGRVGGKGAGRGVGRAGEGCPPEGPGEVVTGTKRGLGPSAEPLPGSGGPEPGKPGRRGPEGQGQLLWRRGWPGLGLGREAGR